MTGILDHVWGRSRAADRVWAQVAGMAPSLHAWRRFMVLEAYIDESFDQGGTFVLGGCISSADRWAAFSRDWESLLPRFGRLDRRGQRRFKMQEYNLGAQEDVEAVAAFWRVIEDHVLGFVSCKIDQSEFERAKARIGAPDVAFEWDEYNTYYVAFRYLIDKFHIHREMMDPHIPINEKVDFYFDDRSEKKAIIGGWEDYIIGRKGNVGSHYGATPRFEDDSEFLPLQAADLWAWWVRKWYAEGAPEKIAERDFGVFQKRQRSKRKFFFVNIDVEEDDVVKNLAKIARDQLQSDKPLIILPKGHRFA